MHRTTWGPSYHCKATTSAQLAYGGGSNTDTAARFGAQPHIDGLAAGIKQARPGPARPGQAAACLIVRTADSHTVSTQVSSRVLRQILSQPLSQTLSQPLSQPLRRHRAESCAHNVNLQKPLMHQPTSPARMDQEIVSALLAAALRGPGTPFVPAFPGPLARAAMRATRASITASRIDRRPCEPGCRPD
jgi:hypothetical protein